MQLHIGALRSVNSQYRERAGANTGFDVMDDYLVARQVNRCWIAQKEGGLPKTILYPLNGQQFQVLAAAAASFPKEGSRGHVQLGSAWWHNDHKEGIEANFWPLPSKACCPILWACLPTPVPSFPTPDTITSAGCSVLL